MFTIRGYMDIYAYGTSEGVKKAWESRGRGYGETMEDDEAVGRQAPTKRYQSYKEFQEDYREKHGNLTSPYQTERRSAPSWGYGESMEDDKSRGRQPSVKKYQSFRDFKEGFQKKHGRLISPYQTER